MAANRTAGVPIVSSQTDEMPFGDITDSARADRAARGLLLAVARASADVGGTQISASAEQVRDWDALLSDARTHRMLPLLFKHLPEMGAAVPQTVRQRLRAEYERNVFHCLANAAELIEILKVFDRQRIPVMPYKGITLAASVYNDLTARPAGDLDLLIHPKHLSKATALLHERGFALFGQTDANGAPFGSDNHESIFERPADGILVELRWQLDLVYHRFRRNLGMDWVWKNRRTAVIAGFEVPDMAPETALLVLCMHGSKHVWSRLIWVCDVAQMLVASPALDWQQAIRTAKRSGLWRSLALGVLLARRIAGAPVPEEVLHRMHADTGALKMAAHFEEHLLDQPGIGPVGLVPYNIQMLDLSDRFSFRLLADFLRPNEKDRAAFPLPKQLYALHYLLRPFRILFGRSPK